MSIQPKPEHEELVAREWTCHAKTTLGFGNESNFRPHAEVGGFGHSSEEDATMAKRMALCWNACRGMSDEQLLMTSITISGRRHLMVLHDRMAIGLATGEAT